MSVNDFVEGRSKHLKVHILKKINGSNYVGGDDSKLLHIKLNPENFGELEENQSYSLIKPEKQSNDEVIANEKFKPAKIAKIQTQKTKQDAESLEVRLVLHKTGSESETFASIDTKADNYKVKKMTVRCLSLSRNIETQYGSYRIAKVRDTENNKGDINLNKHNRNKMEVDKMYYMENIKVGNYRADGSDYRRLATLPSSVIKQVEKMNEANYDHITLGDDRATSVCIGLGKVYGYYGCHNCWKKVEEDDDHCKKCNTPTDNKSMEFSAELYMEMDEDVITAQAFKRQLTGVKIETIDNEDIEKILEEHLVGKKIEMEYNAGQKEDSIMLIKIRKLMQPGE